MLGTLCRPLTVCADRRSFRLPGVARARVAEQPLDPATDALVGEWLDLPAVAARLGVDVGRVRSLVRERALLAVRRQGVAAVPAAFLTGSPASGATPDAPCAIVKGLPGALVVLSDAGFSDVEALRWLFTPDPSLPGTPIAGLAGSLGTEVKRRAQALAL